MKFLTCLCLLIWSTTAIADVPHLIDTDGPEEGVQTLELEELWRRGGEDDDLFFGEVSGITGGHGGNIYVLDHQLCQVTTLSPDGEFVGYLGREGDGPGEVRQAIGVAAMDDGMVGIASGFPGKVVRLNADGTPDDTIFPIGVPAEGHVGVMISLDYVDGLLVASGARLVFDPSDPSGNYADRFLAVCDADCTDPLRIVQKKTPLDPSGQRYVERDDYYIDRRWTLGPGGLVYAPMARDAFEISVYDRTGELQRVFGRSYEPRKRTSDEKEDVRPLIGLGVVYAEIVAEDHDDCIYRLMYDHDNDRVWALSGHGANEPEDGDILETWDVFTSAGTYLRQVRVPRGAGIIDGACFLVGGGRLVVLRGAGVDVDEDEDVDDIVAEPLEIICYRLR